MIIPIMSAVNNWLAILTFNPKNVINVARAHHAGVIRPGRSHEQARSIDSWRRRVRSSGQKVSVLVGEDLWGGRRR